MVQDILDTLVQTEKNAADIVARAQVAALKKAQETDRHIAQLQLELKNELKQKRLNLKTELNTEYAKEITKSQKKTEAKLEKLKEKTTDLSGAADYLVQKILA